MRAANQSDLLVSCSEPDEAIIRNRRAVHPNQMEIASEMNVPHRGLFPRFALEQVITALKDTPVVMVTGLDSARPSLVCGGDSICSIELARHASGPVLGAAIFPQGLQRLVDLARIELATSSLRTMASAELSH